MPKQAIPPKSRSKSHSQSVRGSLSKQLATSTSKISKKPKGNSKSMKLKNEALSEQLDDLFGELTPHLTSKTQKKKKTLDSQRADLETKRQMDSAQQEYEKMNNDMEDALGLLTKL